MKWNLNDRWTRRRLISYAILVVGLVSAFLIYWNAPPENALGYDPEDSKQYLRQMEVYGGKANLLAYDLRQWFSGLWHGRSLAGTVAVIAVLLAAGFRLAAIPVPRTPRTPTSTGSDKPGGGT